MLNPKIADHHLIRNACIYIRQSTMAQVDLIRRAQSASIIGGTSEVAWLDAGADPNPRRGSCPIGRTDDQTRRLQDPCERCGYGTSGCDLLSRSPALGTLEQGLASIAGTVRCHQTLVFDGDGCYDPSDFNDSLVLGMRGTFAQAELHIIRARLHGAKLNRAQKGELRFPLPVGLVFDDDKIVLDPDQEVQGAVRAVFTLFEQENSAYHYSCIFRLR